MPPLLNLVLSMGFMIGLACLLFGAPFVPPFRSFAVYAIMILTTLGNIFVFFVISTTVYIYFRSKNEDKRTENIFNPNERGENSQKPMTKID